ncbi:hypothetical protein VTO73DRAFT_1786 [Trametes versicolor]
MAKKNKDSEPVANLHGVANRDIIQRINFLYQASAYLNSVSQALPTSAVQPQQPAPAVKGKSKKKQKVRHPRDTAELSRSYIGSMRTVGQKTMVRMDPSLKRTLCKSCDTILLPGSTAIVRVRPTFSHRHAVVYTCLTCNASRRIPAPPVLGIDGTLPADNVAVVNTTSAPSPSTPATALQAGGETSTMDADAQSTESPIPLRKKKHKRQRSKATARAPPLFERAGHVVFRGNERLPDDAPVL